MEKAEDLDFAVAFARIECHYFINGIFVEDGHILNNCDKIVNIPTTIIQSRYDMVCPTKALGNYTRPHSNNLVIVPDAGHSMGETSIAGNWLRLLTKFSMLTIDSDLFKRSFDMSRMFGLSQEATLGDIMAEEGTITPNKNFTIRRSISNRN